MLGFSQEPSPQMVQELELFITVIVSATLEVGDHQIDRAHGHGDTFKTVSMPGWPA